MNKQYVLREEPFGYTFFDKQKLRHKLLLKNEMGSFLGDNRLALKDLKYLRIGRKECRKDILYSLSEYILNSLSLAI